MKLFKRKNKADAGLDYCSNSGLWQATKKMQDALLDRLVTGAELPGISGVQVFARKISGKRVLFDVWLVDNNGERLIRIAEADIEEQQSATLMGFRRTFCITPKVPGYHGEL